MKLSELTVGVCAKYIGVDMSDVEGLSLIESVFLPAAKSRAEAYTGQTLEQLEPYEEVTVAVLALCSFLYDNRSMVTDSARQSEVISGFLDAYRANLIAEDEEVSG